MSLKPFLPEFFSSICVNLILLMSILQKKFPDKNVLLSTQQRTICLAILLPARVTLIPTPTSSVDFLTPQRWRTARHCSMTTSPPSRCTSGLLLLPWRLNVLTFSGASLHETSLFRSHTPQLHVVPFIGPFVV